MGKKRKHQDKADDQALTGKANPPQRKGNIFAEYAKAIGVALLIALVLRQFFFQAFRIPTGSMLETMQIGDFLFVNKFLYGAKTPDRIRIGKLTLIDDLPVLKFPALRKPRQGDIIVFEYPRDRTLDYIKRCVAVAGDTVAVRDGIVYVNGKIYESNFADRNGDHSCIPDWRDGDNCPKPHTKHDQAAYLSNPRNHQWPWEGMQKPYVVPAGHIFMMGDNRYNSLDSRYWGALDVNLIKGKAIFLYWSWDKERHLPRLDRIGDLIR